MKVAKYSLGPIVYLMLQIDSYNLNMKGNIVYQA
jgi:hypothetical protein